MAKTEERIDKWMWATRIFKTRTISTDACKKDASAWEAPQPSHRAPSSRRRNRSAQTAGDLQFQSQGTHRKPSWRTPCARLSGNITPQSQLDLLEIVKISGFIDRRKGLGRPTKREGRELSKFTSEAMESDGWDFDFDFDDDDDDDIDNIDE